MVRTTLTQEAPYAGIYAYHIPTNTWRQLRFDVSELRGARANLPPIQHEIGSANDVEMMKIAFRGWCSNDFAVFMRTLSRCFQVARVILWCLIM